LIITQGQANKTSKTRPEKYTSEQNEWCSSGTYNPISADVTVAPEQAKE
jgi:hypothetical protein